jgi:hypothetical protein
MTLAIVLMMARATLTHPAGLSLNAAIALSTPRPLAGARVSPCTFVVDAGVGTGILPNWGHAFAGRGPASCLDWQEVIRGVQTVTLTRSHEVPVGSLPLSAMKEELSMAYIHMLASATGLTLGTWSQDYDCKDTTLSSRVDYPDLMNAGIDIQLKCTGREDVVRKDVIAWSLDPRTVNIMTNQKRSHPTMLCVLIAPPEAEYWLESSVDGLLARSHMYWLWGHQMPAAILTQDTQTVHLPRVNLLTPASLLERMEEASRWKPVLP